jgi:hypothetical protein
MAAHRITRAVDAVLIVTVALLCAAAHGQQPGSSPATPSGPPGPPIQGYSDTLAPPPLNGPAAPTPRTPDGHPDFSGFWGLGAIGLGALGSPKGAPFDGSVALPVRNGDFSNFTNDNVLARRRGDNLPLYKPQYWARVQQLDHGGNKLDPFAHCYPIGPPRIGPPTVIVELPDKFIFFYTVIFQRNDFRIVPMGPRTHALDPDGSWGGDAVAHWDGDTLVVETEGFNDQGWLDAAGYIHGYDLKVTERFRRVGDRMRYDVTVEDPEYLQRPWVLNTREIALDKEPHPYLAESPPCSDRDTEHVVGTQREM